jgi:hypothetical protein
MYLHIPGSQQSQVRGSEMIIGRLKGGIGSGFHDHKGRKGLVGGSAARGVLSSDTKQFRFLVKDTESMREVDTIPLAGRAEEGAYLVLPDSRIIESLQYGHDGIGFDLMDLNMYELANGDETLMKRFEDMGGMSRTNWFLANNKCIRVEQTQNETNFETSTMDLSTLRRLQKLSDDGKITLAKNIVWDGRTFSEDFKHTTAHTTVRATYEEFMSAKFITIDGGAGYLKEYIYKGGAGSGFHGHKGRPGLVGGSTALGVMPRAINGLNIPDAAYADSDMLYSFEQVELFNKLVTHSFGDGIVPRQTLENKIYGSYVISPDGEILQGKNLTESHTEIFAYLALSKPHDFIDEEMRLRATNILFTARDEDEDIELQFLKAGYIDVRSITGSSYAIKFAGEINTNSVKKVLKLIDTGKIPSNYGGTFSLYSIDKHSRAVHIPAAELDSIVGFRTTETGSVYELEPILKELKFKGGIGSGFHGHKGRLGEVGGSIARGVLTSDNSSQIVIPTDTDAVQEVDIASCDPTKTPTAYYILPDNRVIYCKYGHINAAITITKANSDKYESQRFRSDYVDNLLKSGYIRIMQVKQETAIETHLINVEQLRKIQNLVDSNKIVLAPEVMWAGYDAVGNMTRTQIISSSEFMMSKYVTIQHEDENINIVVLKGGAGSGYYGHLGRPGLVGGSKKISGSSIRGYAPQNRNSPFSKLPRGYSTNANSDDTAAYVPSYGKNESAKLSTYHPESQRQGWIYPKSYMTILPEKYSQGIGADYDYNVINGLKDRMRKKLPIDPVFVDIDIETGKVLTQEGRHRSIAAYELNIGRIPMIVYFRTSSGKYVNLSDYSKEQIDSVNPLKYLSDKKLGEEIT